MRWLDTNVILRYLTRDDPVKAQACLALFQRVQQGDEELATGEAVIAEVTYVLSSQYGLDHAEIVARLRPLLGLNGVKIPYKRIVQRALERFAESPRLEFEDALSVEHMDRLGIREIVSYDRDLDRIPEISRHEP